MVGRPSVSVPVLSSTTVSRRPAASSAAPPRTRTPASAPLPVPTMIAVGVARPMAHGQAMITTPMNVVRARVSRGSGPNRNQATNESAATAEDRRHEHLGDPVDGRLDRGLGALGALDERDDVGERRVGADARGAHDERAGRVERRTDDLVATRLRGRDGLARQHRFVDGRRPLDDDPVDRHLLAGSDAQEVADDDRRDLHLDLVVAADESGGLRLQADESADRARRLALGPLLEPATDEDEPDDDRGGVEVGLRVEAGLVDDLRVHRHEHAVGPRGRGTDGDQRVHRGAAVAAGLPGRSIEPAAGPELDERGRPQDELVEILHGDHGLRPEHEDHEDEGRTDRDRGLEQGVPLGRGASRRRRP